MQAQANQVLFAKQPLYDAANNLFGYEILYRDTSTGTASFQDGCQATRELLVNYCSGILDDSTGPYVKVFINLTKELIMSDSFFPLSPDRLVIEILEDTQVDDDLILRISDLKQQGFNFALDDYVVEDRFDLLLPLVDYVKVEIIDLDKAQLAERFQGLMSKTKKLCRQTPILLAEKVEDEKVYTQCKELGFQLFQGYYLAHPENVYGKKVAANSQNALRIVSKLQQEDISVEEISSLVSMDVKLTFQLLKIINSPLCRLPRKIESLQEAVVMLGLKQIKRWAMVMALTGNESTPKALFQILLQRARTCELFALKTNSKSPEKCFTCGLFSGIDAVMHADKEWLLNQIQLSDDIVRAVLHCTGDIGRVLQYVMLLEAGEFEKLDSLSVQEKQALNESHAEATTWANETIPALAG